MWLQIIRLSDCQMWCDFRSSDCHETRPNWEIEEGNTMAQNVKRPEASSLNCWPWHDRTLLWRAWDPAWRRSRLLYILHILLFTARPWHGQGMWSVTVPLLTIVLWRFGAKSPDFVWAQCGHVSRGGYRGHLDQVASEGRDPVRERDNKTNYFRLCLSDNVCSERDFILGPWDNAERTSSRSNVRRWRLSSLWANLCWTDRHDDSMSSWRSQKHTQNCL